MKPPVAYPEFCGGIPNSVGGFRATVTPPEDPRDPF